MSEDETVDVERSRTFAAGKRHVKLIEVDDGHELVASLPRIKAEADAFLSGFLGNGPHWSATIANIP